jgi:hypothetical protein
MARHYRSRKARKIAGKITRAACTFQGPHQCCADKECYAAWMVETEEGIQLVQQLREYVLRLSKPDRAKFASQRVFADLDVYDPTDDLRGKHVHNYYLESATALQERLQRLRVQPAGQLLPAPSGATLTPCCSNFWYWITQVPRAIVNPSRPPGPVSPAEREIVVYEEPQERMRNEKLHAGILTWLGDQAAVSTVLPNREFIILPWHTRRATHEAYCRDIETAMGCPWVHNPAYAQGEHIYARQADDKCRYGNPLLGAKGSQPESPDVASLGYFLRVWRTDPSTANLKVRAWIPFAKCDECVKFRQAIRATEDPNEKRRLRRQQRRHIVFVRRERAAYAKQVHRALVQPDKYMCLVIDGSDQKNSSIPHAAERSKVTEAGYKIKLHVMGVIAHHRKTYAFLATDNCRQGHNVTMQAIWDVIVDTLEREGTLPPNLHIQLDNTTKQNKGKYLFAFLAMLIYRSVFKRITLGFLPVGHTHVDVDQFFSRISVYLRKHNAFSRGAYAKAVVRAHHTVGMTTSVHNWDAVANISDYLEDNDFLVPDASFNCTAYYHFRLFRSKTDQTVWLQARGWPGDAPDVHWQGLRFGTTHTQLLRSMDKIPDLYKDYSKVPPAQRRDQVLAEGDARPEDEAGVRSTFAAKLRKDLEAFRMYFGNQFGADDAEDLEKCIQQLESPADVPFAWSKASMRRVFNIGEGEDDEEKASSSDSEEEDPRLGIEVRDRKQVTPGKFYIIRPSDDAPEPFWIGRVVCIVPDSVNMCEVEYWKAELDEADEDPYYDSAYVVEEDVAVSVCQFSGAGHSVHEEIDMVFGRNRRTTTKKIAVHRRNIAKYWAVHFSGGRDMNYDNVDVSD